MHTDEQLCKNNTLWQTIFLAAQFAHYKVFLIIQSTQKTRKPKQTMHKAHQYIKTDLLS